MLFKSLRFHVFIILLCLSSLNNTMAFNVNSDATVAVKGSFTQSKTIKPLRRPFQSSGEFVYVPNEGLLWQTLVPVQSTKLFAHSGLFNIDDSGKKSKEASLDNAFFLSLFSGDEKALQAYFNVVDINDSTNHKIVESDTDTNPSKLNDKTNASCVVLQPKSSTLQSLFVEIKLCKKQQNNETVKLPSSITLQEHKGNSTVITLNVNAQGLSQKELALFELTPEKG